MKPRMAALPSRLRQAPKTAEPFYSSAAWKALVAQRVGEPDWHAAKARAKRGERLILDHKVERKDGGDDLDPNNTQWLTFGEHQAKTAVERGKRARGER